MAKRNKQTRKHDFTPSMRRRIEERDMGCIFCRMGYHMPENDYFGTHMFSIMHYIPRSQRRKMTIRECLVCGREFEAYHRDDFRLLCRE